MARNSAMTGASLREAAKFLGVDRSTVIRWKAAGWTVHYADGSIDVAATRRRAEANRDGRGRPPKRAPRTSFTDPSTDPPPGEDDGADDPSYLKARARKELAQAQLAELELQRKRGEVISLEDARKVYVSVITSARVALEAVPARVAPRVVGLTSAVDIRRIVQGELASALRSLSDEPPAVG